MTSFGEVIAGVVSHFFPSFSSANQEPTSAPRREVVCAAPCSMYQSFSERRPTADSFMNGGSVLQSGGLPTGYRSFAHPQESFYDQGGSFYQDGSVCHSGSVYEGTSPQMPPPAAREPTLFRPAPLPDVHIPFKDGSSQIQLRRSWENMGQGAEFMPEMNLLGGSYLRSNAYMAREAQFFISDPEDIVDVQVAEYFKARPDVYLRTGFTRIRQGIYSMFGREVHVCWVESKNKEKKGRLVVKDGHLRQPFGDYMEMKDTISDYNCNSQYKSFYARPGGSNIHMIPQECRMTFCDPGVDYTRIDAMKVAREQATAREAAATDLLTKQGQAPAVDRLKMKFEDIQLGAPARQKQVPEMRSPGVLGSLPTPPRVGASSRVNSQMSKTLHMHH